jgi:hypothetical protein
LPSNSSLYGTAPKLKKKDRFFLIKNNKLLEGGGEKNSKKIQKKMEKL